jgi:nitroreductase
MTEQAPAPASAFLAARRSYPARALRAPAPSGAALEAILSAGLRVPDHGRLEPWRLLVIRGGGLARLAEAATARIAHSGRDPEKAAKSAETLAASPLVVVVVASPRASDSIPAIEQTLSAGAVCLSLVNAALADGWGAAWLTGWIAYDRALLEDVLGLAPHETVAGLIHIGTPEGPRPPERARPDLARAVGWIEG